MQHYTKNNHVVGRPYEPEEHDELLSDGWLAITIDEARAITTPAPVPPTKSQRIATLLAPYKLERISIQMVIGMAEMRADLTALQTGGLTTRAADLAQSFTRNTAYRIARTLEDKCLGIEGGA